MWQSGIVATIINPAFCYNVLMSNTKTKTGKLWLPRFVKTLFLLSFVYFGLCAIYGVYLEVFVKHVHPYDKYMLFIGIGAFAYMILVGIYLLATGQVSVKDLMKFIFDLLGT